MVASSRVTISMVGNISRFRGRISNDRLQQPSDSEQLSLTANGGRSYHQQGTTVFSPATQYSPTHATAFYSRTCQRHRVTTVVGEEDGAKPRRMLQRRQRLLEEPRTNITNYGGRAFLQEYVLGNDDKQLYRFLASTVSAEKGQSDEREIVRQG